MQMAMSACTNTNKVPSFHGCELVSVLSSPITLGHPLNYFCSVVTPTSANVATITAGIELVTVSENENQVRIIIKDL